jgi:hypothetical protein
MMEIQAVSSVTTISSLSQLANESASTSKTSQPDTQKAGKAPPPGGKGGGITPAATSENSNNGSSSSTTKIYDKRDTNQDGIVSYQEELLYSLKNPMDESQDQSTVSASQKQTGLNAYQQNQPKNFTSI